MVASRTDGEKVNILLVDDAPANLLALEAILARSDYNLLKATSARAGLQILHREPIAIVLLDVMMPEMDGFQFALEARANDKTRHVPIIFVTAVASEAGYVAKGYEYGAADYLTKPLDADEVKAKVAVFVELYRKNRRLQETERQLRLLNQDLERRAEARAKDLAASNERFRVFVEGVREYGFIQMDEEGRFITWNGGAERLLGYSEMEIIGLPFAKIFTPEDTAAGIPEVELSTARQEGRANDTRWHQRKDGSRFWARGITTALFDDKMRLRGYAKVLRDETDHKRAQDALKASETQLRLVTDAIPALVCYLDRDQRYRFGNEAHKEWFGIGPHQLRGKHVREVFGGEVYDDIQTRIAKALEGEQVSFDTELSLPAGAKKFVSGTYTPDTDDHGHINGIVGLINDLTDHRQTELALRETEKALRESQQWFESAINLMPIAVIVVELESGRVVSTNQAARTLTDDNYPITLPPENDSDHYATDIEGRILPRTLWPRFRTARGEKLSAFEVTWHWPGGSRPLIVNSTILPPMYGSPARGVITFQDITSRKDAEQALTESRVQLADIQKAAGVAGWAWTLATNEVSWSGAIEEVYGFRPKCYLEFWEAIHPDDQPTVRAAANRAIWGHEDFYADFRIVWPDGNVHWLVGKGKVTRNHEGQAIRIIGINMDITARKTVEETKGNLAAIVTSSDDAIVTKALDGMVTSWNAGAESMFGYRPEEVIGKPVAILVPKDRCDEEQRFMEMLLRGERVSHYETVRLRKDGLPVPVSLSISPVKDAAGKTIAIAIIARDITDQKRGEEDLRRAKESAEAANRSKSQFLANMSHEIRTPLNAIVGFAELLDDEALSGEDRKQFGSTIRRNGRLLSQLIDDILDLSKVEAGKLAVEKVKCRLPDLLDDVKTLLGQQAREKGIRLLIRSDGEVPESLYTDPIRLKQILINIIGNAIKFTAKGGVDVTVKYADSLGEAASSKLTFVVKDTGRGISPEQAKRLFQPFSQADASTTRTYGGTGLGLVLARRLAEALSGTVNLTESELGRGSIFSIELDVDLAEGRTLIGTDQQHSSNSLNALRGEQPLSGLRILVAEDSPDSRILINRILKGGGADVEMAGDGAEAIEKALEYNPDIILMDLQMPKVDGLKAAAELRQRGFGKPIIALTAHAMKEERESCLRAGCDDHLTKPINISELVAKVSHLGRGEGNRHL